MIVKKLKRTSFKKSKSVMIGGLVDYILAEHDDRGKDKLAYAGSRNFLTTTVAAQKREMISLAEESIQSKMPVTHWILSWQENEQPTSEQVDEAVSLFLRGMGLAEHQTIYALHKNTGNYHLHIAVNRTHPYTQKVIQPHRGFDINEAHKIIAEIEHRQGWAPQMNARYRVNEQGHVVKNLQRREQMKPKPKAEDFENATGEKSAMRIAQERAHAVIQNATCWEELHAGLDMVGLRFVRKGSGAVIFVGDTAVKASSGGQKFFPVQAVQTTWRVQARLLFRTNIQEIRPGAGQSRLPGGMVGVPAGETEGGGRKTPRQKEAGGRTGRAGTAAAGTPGGG